MKRLVFIAVFLVVLAIPVLVHAEETCDAGVILPPCTCSGDCQLTDFLQLFVNLYAFGVHLAAPLAVFFIIIGSVVLVTASGYSNRIEMGKTMITQAVVGLVIVLTSWVIIDTAIFVITGNADRTVFEKKWFQGFTYVCKNELLYQGCTGGNVSSLQRSLVALGYTLKVDGSYGPETTAVVHQFQQDANSVFVANARNACGGKAGGIDVWNYIFSPVACPPDCTVPDDTAKSKQLIVNGSAGATTQAAIQKFQGVAPQFQAACKT